MRWRRDVRLHNRYRVVNEPTPSKDVLLARFAEYRANYSPNTAAGFLAAIDRGDLVAAENFIKRDL
jgi:hypothetical protein